ncbi:MAG: nucleoside triphosphate pyrophosphatase [Rhodanobacteraceae bacterium]
MRHLVLASGSVYRARQLGTLGLEFDTCPADIDETPAACEPAADLVQRLSLQKARTAASRHPAAVVIGSDQVATLDQTVIGKPGTRENARRQLLNASGRSLRFVTGLCVLDPAMPTPQMGIDITTVRFRTLRDEEIERYLDKEEPLDCAGSFKCEGLGISLFDAIETRDPSALIGLPLIALGRMLRECGFPVP